MGIFQDFLTAALEADDITGEVQDETSKALGSKSITSKTPKRDIMETDDILGTKSKSSVQSAAPAADTDKDAPINHDNDDSNNIEDEPLSDDNTEDNFSLDDNDSQLGDELSEDATNDQPSDELKNKIRLRENMILFYNILSTNIKLLSDSIPNTDVTENNEVLNKVSRNLSDCKSILYRLITEEIHESDYATILRKYIGLNQVYDLSIKLLTKHFNNLALIDPSNKSKSKKDYKELNKKMAKEKDPENIKNKE